LVEDDPRRRGTGTDGDPPLLDAQPPHPAATGVRDALRSRRFIGLCAASLLGSFGVFVPFVHLVPYAIDLSKVPVGRTPVGWLNCQGMFSVVKMPDGTSALKKRNDAPSPLVARAHAFIGLPNMTGYTIQADVQGNKLRNEMPDMGVEANRYSLHLIGNTQQLRLISWDALPRVDNTIAFPWKPGVWYRRSIERNGNVSLAKL